MALSITRNLTANAAAPMDIDTPTLWHWLPPNIYYKIFSDTALSARDLLNASRTCRQWHFYIGHYRVTETLLDRLPRFLLPCKMNHGSKPTATGANSLLKTMATHWTTKSEKNDCSSPARTALRSSKMTPAP